MEVKILTSDIDYIVTKPDATLIITKNGKTWVCEKEPDTSRKWCVLCLKKNRRGKNE